MKMRGVLSTAFADQSVVCYSTLSDYRYINREMVMQQIYNNQSYF